MRKRVAHSRLSWTGIRAESRSAQRTGKHFCEIAERFLKEPKNRPEISNQITDPRSAVVARSQITIPGSTVAIGESLHDLRLEHVGEGRSG